MDWDYIFSIQPHAIEDHDKDALLNTIAWYDIDIEEVDVEKCMILLKISQEIMKYKSEQVEALVEELDELAKKQAEDEMKYKESDLETKSQRSKKSSSLEYDELEEKYREIKNKLKSQSKSNEKLKKEINRLNQHVKTLEQDRNHLQNELQALQKDETLSEASENAKDQQRELVETIREKNKQIAQLLNDIETADKENLELKDQLIQLKDKLAEATREINKLTEEFVGYKVDIEEKNGIIDDLKRQNDGLNAEIEDLLIEKNEMKKQLEDFAREIDRRVDDWKTIIDEKNREIDELKSRVKPGPIERDSSESSQDESKTNRLEISTLNKVIMEQNYKIRKLQKQLEKGTEEMIKTTEMIDNISGEKQINVEQLKEVKQMNKELKTKLKSSHDRCQKLQMEIVYLQELLVGKDEDINEILNKLKKGGEMEIGDFLEKYQNLKMEKRIKEKQVVDLVRDINKLQGDFEKYERENLELRSRLGLSEDGTIPTSHVLAKQKKHKKLVGDLQAKITKLESEKLDLRLEIQRQSRIIDNLKEQLTELEVIPIIETKNDDERSYVKNEESIRLDGQINSLMESALNQNDHRIVVEENEALRKGLHEILNSLQDRKDKGFREINSETLEKLLKALDSKHIAGWYHSGMRLQAEIHSLEGTNKELREQLRLARMELNAQKLVDQNPTETLMKPSFEKLNVTQENKDIISDLNNHISNVLKQYNNQKEQNEILVKKLESYKNEFTSVKEQLVLLYKEYSEAKIQWNEEKLKMSHSADEISEKVEVLERKLDEIKTMNLTDDEEMKVKQISELAGQVVVLNRKCLYLEDENIRLTKDLNQVKTELLNAELAVMKKITSLNEENQLLMNKAERLDVQLKNKIDLNLHVKLQNEFDDLTVKHRNLMKEITKISISENNQLEITKRKVEILTEEKENLLNKIQELTMKINSFKVASFEIEKATEILTKKLSQSEVNEISEKQRANHMGNLYELVKEQLRKSEERLREFEKYNKEIMEKNLKLQETIRETENKVLNNVEINFEEYSYLMKKHEELIEENEDLKKGFNELKLKFETMEKLSETQKLWTSSQEYEFLSLKHQILDLQAVTDDKAVISRLSSDVVQARIMEAEALKKYEHLKDDYDTIEAQFGEYNKNMMKEIDFKETMIDKLQLKIRDLQEIVMKQRQQYLGYVPLVSESKYIENIREIHVEKYRYFLEVEKIENLRHEVEIVKEQLGEKLKIVDEIKSHDLKDKITKWYNEKSLIQLQELKQKRKSEFLQNQLDQALEKIKMQDGHMSELEEALYFAYQLAEVDIPKNLENINLRLINSENNESKNDVKVISSDNSEGMLNKINDELKVFKSEEVQTLLNGLNSENVDDNREQMKAVEKLQLDLAEKENQLKIKEESLEQLRSRITELEMNISLFKTQLGDKQSQITFYEKHILELQSKKEVPVEENEEYLAMTASISKLQGVIREKEDEILKYQSLLKKDRDEHSLAAQRMQEELRRLHAVLVEHQQAYKELKDAHQMPKDAQQDGSLGKLAVEQYIKQVHALETHTNELHTNLTAVENQLQAAREECVRWRSLANDRLETMEKLRKDLEEMHRNEIKVYKDDCEKWRQEVLSLKAFVTKLQGCTSENSAELQKLIKDKDNRIHELTVQLRQLRIAARKRVETVDVLPQLQEFETEKEQLLKEIDTLKKKCENLLNKERNYREEIRNLKTQLMKRPLTSARSDKSDTTIKDQLYKKVSTLEKENAELKENLQQQLLANEAHRAKVAEDFDRWNKQKFFQQTAEKLKLKLKEKSDEFDKLQQTCSGYRLLIEKLEREKHALETKNKNLKTNPTIPTRLEMLEIENAKLRAEIEAANAKYEMAQHHSGGLGAAMLQEKLEAQERKLAILELAGKGTTELRNEIERLQSALANLHKINLRLEAENLEYKLDLEKSAKDMPYLKEQIQHLESYIELLKAENSSKEENRNPEPSTQPESKKVSELERTVFVLKRIVEKLQAENKRLQNTNRICNDKVSDLALRRDFHKLKEQYGDAVQRIARLEEELRTANIKLKSPKFAKTLDNDLEDIQRLKTDLEQKTELLDKVKVLLHRAATKEKALLEEISRLKSMIPCSSTSVSSN